MADITLMPEQSAGDLNFKTSADLSALQYHFVKLSAAELVVAATGNDKTLGILQNAPNGSTDSAVAVVRVYGVSKLSLAETVAFGQFLTSTAASKGEIADAANEEYGAIAMSSGEATDSIAVLIQRGEVTASDV